MSVKYRQNLGAMMLLADGDFFAELPFTGEETTNGAFSTSQFFPALWSRELASNPAGGKGLALWDKIKSFSVAITYAVTPDVGSPFAISGTATVTRVGAFNDERDALDPDSNTWVGAFTSGTQSGDVEIQIFTVAAPDGSVSFPATKFYITEDSVAPSFWIQVANLSESAAGFSSGIIRSYTTVDFSVNGTGQLLAETFDIYTEDHSVSFPYTITSASLNITGLVYYAHLDTYDTSTGLYLPGVTTNQFAD